MVLRLGASTTGVLPSVDLSGARELNGSVGGTATLSVGCDPERGASSPERGLRIVGLASTLEMG